MPRGPCRSSPTPVTSRPLVSLAISPTVKPRAFSAVGDRLGEAGRVGGVEDAQADRGRVERRRRGRDRASRRPPARRPAAPPGGCTYHHTATAARASTSRKISGGSGRRPLRGRTGGRSVRSVTVTLLGGTRRAWVGRPEFRAGRGPRWHRRPARRVPAPRTGRCARRSRDVSLPAMAPAAERATMPAMIAANLKKANPTYQLRSDRSAPVRWAYRSATSCRVGKPGSVVTGLRVEATLLPGLRPVDEHHPDVGQRVAERRHLPVEDRLDPARRRRGRAGSCPAGSRRGRCSTAGWPAPSRPAGRPARRGPGRSLVAGGVPLLGPAPHLAGGEALGPAEVGEADRVVVDRVQVGQDVDQALADRPALGRLVGVAGRELAGRRGCPCTRSIT